MALVLKDLAANIGARRSRREKAFLAVQALRRQPALALGETVVGWLRSAYGWEPRAQSVAPPDWILGRQGRALLLRVLNGDQRATWQDFDEVAALGAHYGVDLTAIAAPAGVPEPDELLSGQWEDVRAWGPAELETIYVEIEHEVGGLEF